MKPKYIISFVLGTFLLSACQQKELVDKFESLSVEKSFVSISTEGGTAVLKVTSADGWTFAKSIDSGKKDDAGKAVFTELPSWLTASTLSGAAGNTDVTFTAGATSGGREAELEIVSGSKTVFVRVRQGSLEATAATVKEIYAGPDGKTYRVTGTCTGIYNTTYGNWYLDDGSNGADVLTIYGTLDKDGKTKNFTSLNIEVGDVVTVEGPKSTYGSTIELVDVTVIKIEKSLVKIVDSPKDAAAVEGADVKVTVAYKGSGVYPSIADDARAWLQYKETEFKKGVPTIFEKEPADTAIVTFSLSENLGGDREGVVYFTSSNSETSSTASVTIAQKGAIKNVTVAEFLAAAEGSSVYRLNGLITGLYASDSQGKSFYIQDYSGSVLVYRAEGFETSGAKVGDIVTVCGKRTSYKETPQMGSATFEAIDKVVTAVKVADFLAAAESKDVWYMISGTVEKPTEEGTKWDIETYGNLNLRDETGSVYVYGVSTGINGESKKFSTLGVKEGDKMTIIGYRTSYKGLNQVGGGMYVSHEAGGGQGGGGGDTSKGKYVAVSSTQTDWAGKYLIVWENGAHGTASNKDLAKTVDVTIADGAIAASEEINAAAVTVAAMEGGYSITLSDGKFLTFTTNGNQCTFADAAAPMNFGYTDTGIKVYGVDTADNTRYLMMNASGSTPYFRGYRETSFIKEGSWVQGYSYPHLYKFVAQ